MKANRFEIKEITERTKYLSENNLNASCLISDSKRIKKDATVIQTSVKPLTTPQTPFLSYFPTFLFDLVDRSISDLIVPIHKKEAFTKKTISH